MDSDHFMVLARSLYMSLRCFSVGPLELVSAYKLDMQISVDPKLRNAPHK